MQIQYTDPVTGETKTLDGVPAPAGRSNGYYWVKIPEWTGDEWEIAKWCDGYWEYRGMSNDTDSTLTPSEVLHNVPDVDLPDTDVPQPDEQSNVNNLVALFTSCVQQGTSFRYDADTHTVHVQPMTGPVITGVTEVEDGDMLDRMADLLLQPEARRRPGESDDALRERLIQAQRATVKPVPSEPFDSLPDLHSYLHLCEDGRVIVNFKNETVPALSRRNVVHKCVTCGGDTFTKGIGAMPNGSDAPEEGLVCDRCHRTVLIQDTVPMAICVTAYDLESLPMAEQHRLIAQYGVDYGVTEVVDNAPNDKDTPDIFDALITFHRKLPPITEDHLRIITRAIVSSEEMLMVWIKTAGKIVRYSVGSQEVTPHTYDYVGVLNMDNGEPHHLWTLRSETF